MDLLQHQTKTENKRYLERLVKEAQRRRGLTDLHYLCTDILGYKDLTDVKGFHGKLCRHLSNDNHNFKLTLTPRGSLKSSVGTVGHSIQLILNNPNTRGLIASQGYKLSVAQLSEIKGHFEKNQKLIDIYGDYVGETWNQGEIIVKHRNIWRASPTVQCAGIDVTKTGFHYDWIKVDDPHDDKNTTSQDQIDKVIRWYRLLLSLLDPGGHLYITGTIWHFNDLYNHLILKDRERVEKGNKPKFKIFKRDAFKGTNEDLLLDNIPREDFLWPERLSPEFLKDQYIEQGPYIFNCQYRLTPVDDENAIFRRSWIKTCDYHEIPKHLHVYTTIDPMRDEDGKDFLSLVTVGYDVNWKGYILDVKRLKADEHDTLETMYKVYDEFHSIKLGMETVAWQKSFYKYNKMLQIMRGRRLPVTELKTDTRTTKRMRIKSMVPYWKSGLFIVPCKNGDLRNLQGGMATLIDELTRFPKTANDDCIDALAYQNQLSSRPSILKIIKIVHPGSFMAIRAKIKKPKRVLGSKQVRKRA